LARSASLFARRVFLQTARKNRKKEGGNRQLDERERRRERTARSGNNGTSRNEQHVRETKAAHRNEAFFSRGSKMKKKSCQDPFFFRPGASRCSRKCCALNGHAPSRPAHGGDSYSGLSLYWRYFIQPAGPAEGRTNRSSPPALGAATQLSSTFRGVMYSPRRRLHSSFRPALRSSSSSDIRFDDGLPRRTGLMGPSRADPVSYVYGEMRTDAALNVSRPIEKRRATGPGAWPANQRTRVSRTGDRVLFFLSGIGDGQPASSIRPPGLARPRRRSPGFWVYVPTSSRTN